MTLRRYMTMDWKGGRAASLQPTVPDGSDPEPATGGGGPYFPTPPLVFAGADIDACRTARDGYFQADADRIKPYQSDQFLAILLKPEDSNAVIETYLTGEEGAAYDASKWIDRTSTATEAYIESLIATWAKRNNPSGQIPDSLIPAGIMRDAELTVSAILRLLSLTQTQLDDLFTGATVSGAGATRTITITQADGSTISLAVPDTGGGGSEGGSSDGAITGASFSADGMTLTITRSAGANIVVSIPAALRNAGLSQSAVQALIDAAEADDLSAADVAAQIRTALMNFQDVPQVITGAINQNISADAFGNTYRLTGSNARTFFLPAASGASPVPDGWEFVAVNDSSADLTITPDGADRIDGNAALKVPNGDAVRMQKIAAGQWQVIADTAKGSSSTGTTPVVGGGFDTEELGSANIDVTTAWQFVKTGITSPTKEESKWLLVNFSRGGTTDVSGEWFWVDVEDLLGLTQVAVGTAKSTSNSLIFREAMGGGNDAYLGIGADREIFLTTPVASASGDPTPFTVRKLVAGEAAQLEDNSIPATKAEANTEALRKAWRERLGSSRISAGNTLPEVDNANLGDVALMTEDVENGLSFVDVSDPSTVLDSAKATDFMQLIQLRAKTWVRFGNIFEGHRAMAAAAAANVLSEANKNQIDKIVGQPHFEMVPGYVYGGNAVDPLGTYHILMQTAVGAYPTANIVRINIEGTPVLAQGYDPTKTQRVLQWELSKQTVDNLVSNNNLDIGDTLEVYVELRAPGPVSLATWRVDIPVIAKPAGVRARFETALAASPAVLPKGTEEIVGYMTKTGKQGRFLFSISLTDIPAVSTDFHVDSRNPVSAPTDAQSVGIRLAYVPATRTLTYSPLPVGASNSGNGVIGSIRARGFA